jgi:hypothetical protein
VEALLAYAAMPGLVSPVTPDDHHPDSNDAQDARQRAGADPALAGRSASLFGALLGGAQFGRGRERWEDLKKLLFIYVPQRAPAIALSRTVGPLFSVKSIGAGPAPK